jgi:pimeloyl-ACP methyl ester carboxylesterase
MVVACDRVLSRAVIDLPRRIFMKSQTVEIVVGARTIHGDLEIPTNSSGIVVFAHGSGSSRHSRRNKFVADFLNRGGLATLLIDLLTRSEEAVDAQTGHLRFNIPFLSDRLVRVIDWVREHPETVQLAIGCFGASTGAAAALVAAASRPEIVKAIVSRGGRPDLAGKALAHVSTPALLIVGGNDRVVVQLTYQAAHMLRAPYRIEIIPGAGHLFEEPGMLEKVARLASEWFQKHLILHATDAA